MTAVVKLHCPPAPSRNNFVVEIAPSLIFIFVHFHWLPHILSCSVSNAVWPTSLSFKRFQAIVSIIILIFQNAGYRSYSFTWLVGFVNDCGLGILDFIISYGAGSHLICSGSTACSSSLIAFCICWWTAIISGTIYLSLACSGEFLVLHCGGPSILHSDKGFNIAPPTDTSLKSHAPTQRKSRYLK